ncbi:sodium- and chloride-dependent GABA transporter 2 [Biomphalaria glabrata]|nr:sodium- and chloride-dependent GABA transporter 2-like [Biomphalaria glabrata]KAI8798522.1 sodium- and chloride-dependent GABA transporter 2 [Biomphalaria glabrata]
MAKRSLLREDFRGSDRTLVSSSLDSNNSSRSNVHAYASSSYYTNSNNDIGADEEEEDEDEEDDEGRQRPEELESDKGIWEKTSHYVLLGFGTVFGVRNILKFPALAIEHGGGAFVFTYVFLTFTVGVPIVYLEVSLGQYARGGVVKAWRMIPLTKGK